MSNDNPFRPPEEDFRDVPGKYHDGLEYVEAREVWPLCVECGKRVEMTCPFCKTVDDLFPLGDPTYWAEDLGDSLVDYQKNVDRELSARSVLFGEGDTSIPESGEHGGCQGGCHDGCCSDEEPEESWFTVDDPPLVLMCPTCADVFVADFPSKCLRCRSTGEDFGSVMNDEEEQISDGPILLEESQGSAFFMIGVFLVFFLIVVTVIYFVF